MKYHILTDKNINTFLQNIPKIREYFDDKVLISKEIGDGNLNFVFLVQSEKNPKKALILKQAVPYLRCAGESFALSRDRMSFEIRALRSYEKFTPSLVPKIYYSDEEMSLVVMEYLGEHIIFRRGLMECRYYENFCEHISTFLAYNLFYTSSLHLESSKKRQMMDSFNKNRELCKLSEDFVFTFAYMEHETNVIDANALKDAKELFLKMEFRKNVLKLKYIFMTKSDALLHGDLHTGSIMVNEKESFVIDPEFAFFGPFGFDIGALVANLINSYISHLYESEKRKYREWILKTIEEIYEKFELKFLELWDNQKESSLIVSNFIDEKTLLLYKKDFMQDIFCQSVGFAGCKMARRVFGIAGVEEIRGIEDLEKRADANKKALKIGIKLIENYENIKNTKELIKIIKESS